MRVHNFETMEQAMAKHEPFNHRSYSAWNEDGKYKLRHWSTEIAWICEDGSIAMFDTDYYSNTTSAFQGRIIRNAMSAKGRYQLRHLLENDKLRGITIPA